MPDAVLRAAARLPVPQRASSPCPPRWSAWPSSLHEMFHDRAHISHLGRQVHAVCNYHLVTTCRKVSARWGHRRACAARTGRGCRSARWPSAIPLRSRRSPSEARSISRYGTSRPSGKLTSSTGIRLRGIQRVEVRLNLLHRARHINSVRTSCGAVSTGRRRSTGTRSARLGAGGSAAPAGIAGWLSPRRVCTIRAKRSQCTDSFKPLAYSA